MKKSNRIVSANDNSPSQEVRGVLYKAVGQSNNDFFQSIKSASYLSHQHIPDITIKNNMAPRLKNHSLKMSVILWVTALVLGLINIILDTSTEIKTFIAIAVLWTGLWTSYVAADYNKWRLSELAIVSSLGGLMSAIMIGSDYLGLNLALIDGIILMSLLSVSLGYVLKSRIAIFVSICATLLWAIMGFMGLAPINNIVVLFPLLTALQIYASSRIESKLAIGLAVLTGYFGLIGFIAILWIQNLLPLIFASSLLFIVGAAHHRAGKAAEDSKIIGSNFHIYSGWIASIISAVIFQYFWLTPEAAATSRIAIGQTGLDFWKTAVSLSILVIFISGIIRFKHTQITLTGIFLLTLVSALIPLMVWFPNGPEALAANIPGINAVPAFGIVIGGAIIAASMGFALNGIRRESYTRFILGLSVLGIEAFLLISPSLMTLDHILVFCVALLTAFTISGVIAGNSLAFKAPAPR